MRVLHTLFVIAAAVPCNWAQTARPDSATLIAVLGRTDATLHEKARACQQLGEYGGKEAVPALAALLRDAKLSAYARSGLEGIPDPSAAAALRAGLDTLKGDLLIGVVNSLGVLRDVTAVPSLSRLASDPASGASREALLALGRIGTVDSIALLRKALTSEREQLRADAAAACLHAAERQMSAGKPNEAIALYDAVRAATVPSQFRLAATRGAIVSRGPAGVEVISKLLKSDEREIRNIALYAVREKPSPKLADALNGAMSSAKPEVQAQLIEALIDCHNPHSVKVVRGKTSSERPEVRAAAWKALGKIGDQQDLAGLIQAAQSGQIEEASAATESLARAASAEVDGMILKALSAASVPAARVALINIIDDRPPVPESATELLKQAADADLNVSLAALRAMRSVVGPGELAALIALTRKFQDGSQRAAAESALYYAATRTGNTTQSGDLLLSELRGSTEALDKASWIKTISAIGYEKALPAVSASLRDSNAWLVGTTIDNLGKWPNPAPVAELLTVVETTSNPNARARALTGAIQLAATAGDRNQASSATIAGWFERAGKAAKTAEDRRVIVYGLGRWRSKESLRLLAPYLEDADLKTAAAQAILASAQSLSASPDIAMLKPVLDKISDMKDPALNERIEILRGSIAAAESANKARKAGNP